MKRSLALAVLATLPCAAFAQGDTFYGEMPQPPFEHRMAGPPPSIERSAMDNLLAQSLSQRSGRGLAEVTALLQQAPPPAVAEQLGLSEADMKELFKAAHAQLVERAQAAGLITAEQAQKLRDAPMFGRRVFGRHEKP